MFQRLRRRFEVLQRDVATVVRDLQGQHPSPLVTRPPRPYVARGVEATARQLVVRALEHPTDDSTAITLADPSGAPIAFVPGQFLTLLVNVDGMVHRRAYSICSSHREAQQVTVCAKRIAGGKVSTHLRERLAVGDAIPVLGPSGEFTLAPDPAARRSVVLIAGGSGITPILAISRALLADEPGSRATLIYGNRRAADAIFAAELDRLADGERLVVRHVLEEPAGRRLDRAGLGAELDAIADRLDDATHYYVCGPAGAMAAAREELAARGVGAERVHEERFATPERARKASSAQRLTLRRGKAVIDAVVPPDGTILEAGLAAGVSMPFSCAMGGCGACAVQLVSGEVDLDEPNCLTPAERAGGKILACCARPGSAVVVEVPR